MNVIDCVFSLSVSLSSRDRNNCFKDGHGEQICQLMDDIQQGEEEGGGGGIID